MFDIGSIELLVVAVVALLVLGPERLPVVLRTMGLWLGRLRRSFGAIKTEIENEIGMDDIRRQLHNEAVLDEIKRIEDEVHGNSDTPDADEGSTNPESTHASSAESTPSTDTELDTSKPLAAESTTAKPAAPGPAASESP